MYVSPPPPPPPPFPLPLPLPLLLPLLPSFPPPPPPPSAQQEAQAGSGSGSGEDHLLSPKILFTPNTSCVRSIIQRTNRTFAVAGILAEWANSVATCTAYLLQNDTRSAIITVSQGLHISPPPPPPPPSYHGCVCLSL